jgi:transposase
MHAGQRRSGPGENPVTEELCQKDKEIKQLQRDLHRKEAVLAETAALPVLRKRADAIWGDGEDA